MIILLVGFVAFAASACSDSKKCSDCLADTTCTWCQGNGFGSCADTSMASLFCPASAYPKTYDSTAGCPDLCAPNAVTAGNCNIPSGGKVQSLTSCNAANTVATTMAGATPAPTTACTAAYTTDGAACTKAVEDFSCSYSCQACSDGGLGLPLCSSVCATFMAACPTVVSMASCNPFSAYVCANSSVTSPNCVGATVSYIGAGGPASASTAAPTTSGGTTAAGGTSVASGTTVVGGTTVAGVTTAAGATGDKCPGITGCTACTGTSGCHYCSTGMTRIADGTGFFSTKCVNTSVSCTAATFTDYTAPSQCIFDLNTACKTMGSTCTSCSALPASLKCGWCNTGGVIGINTGSCAYVNGTTSCDSGVAVTTASKCGAPATTFLASLAALVAMLALLV